MVSSGLCQIVGIFLTGPIIHYFCKNHPTHGYFWTAFFSSFLDNYMSLKLFYTTLFSRKKDNTKILTIKKIDRSGHSALKSEIRVQYLAGVSALTVLKFKKSIYNKYLHFLRHFFCHFRIGTT